MQFDWIYYPATQYLITGVGLLASLCLWLSAKSQLRVIHRNMTKSIETLNSGLSYLTAGVEEIRKSSQTTPETVPLPAASPVGQAINLTKRAQVLRMRHRGESVNSIAAALQIHLGEVVLLLKLERLLDPEPAEAALEKGKAGVTG